MTERTSPKEFYTSRYHLFGDAPEAFDWGSRASQTKRFQVLARIGDLNGRSVLDVGCGTADFYIYLMGLGISCDYAGCDMVPEFIEAAQRKVTGRFYLGDFFALDFKQKYQYVICSGMLNFLDTKACQSTPAILEKAFSAVDKMVDLAVTGAAINFRSSLARPPANQHVCTYEPIQVLAYCLAKYGPRVLLDHSYLPHDFTVFIDNGKQISVD